MCCELAAYHLLLLVFWFDINRLDTTELRLNEQECMRTQPDILSLYQSLINWYRTTEPETVSQVCGCLTGVDVCAQEHDCQHICINSGDSFKCKCRAAYMLNADQKTCSHKTMNLSTV